MKRLKYELMVLLVALSFLSPISVFAKKTIGDAFKQLDPVAQRAGIEEKEVEPIIGRAIKGGLVAVGMIFFVLMVYAGITWMTARGDEGSVEKAQKTIVAAIIGIVVVVGSYAMTNLVVERLLKGQKGPPVPGAEQGKTINEGPLGCCVDWVARDPAEDNPIPACQIIRQRACQLGGETVNDSDRFACNGPKEGCWQFDENIQLEELCTEQYCGRDAGGIIEDFIHEGGVDLEE